MITKTRFILETKRPKTRSFVFAADGVSIEDAILNYNASYHNDFETAKTELGHKFRLLVEITSTECVAVMDM